MHMQGGGVESCLYKVKKDTDLRVWSDLYTILSDFIGFISMAVPDM